MKLGTMCKRCTLEEAEKVFLFNGDELCKQCHKEANNYRKKLEKVEE